MWSRALTTDDRRKQIQADIQRYSSACGCELGLAFLVGATIIFLVYLNYGPVSWSAGGSVWRGIVWVISMSAAGKCLGLAYARVRLHMLRAAQRREFPELDPTAPKESEVTHHGLNLYEY